MTKEAKQENFRALKRFSRGKLARLEMAIEQEKLDAIQQKAEAEGVTVSCVARRIITRGLELEAA